MGTDTSHTPGKMNIYHLTLLITTVTILGFLFTWDFLVYSMDWTYRILISLYVFINLLCYMLGALPNTESSGSKSNKHSKINKKFKDVIKCAVIFVLSTGICHFVTILFGVPLLVNCFETLQFSTLMSSILVFPGLLLWGGDEMKWLRIVVGTGPQTLWESIWLQNAIFCIAGAWFGAFVIPLDWERPWQVWPISCTYGALMGYSVGLAYSLRHQQHGSHKDQRKFV